MGWQHQPFRFRPQSAPQSVPFLREAARAAMISELIHKAQSLPLHTLVSGFTGFLIAFLAGLAFTRGAMRQVLGMIALAVGTGVGLYVFRHRVDVFGGSAAGMGTDRLLMFSALSGLISYALAKVVIQMLATAGIVQLVAIIGWRGALTSVIPTGFLVWVMSLLLRLIGNIYGLETASKVARTGASVEHSLGSATNTLRQAIDRSFLGRFVTELDPLAVRPTANLSRLLIIWPEKRLWPQLAANPKTAAVFAHPKLRDLGHDAAVRQCIDKKDYAGLMQLPQVENAASYPDLEPKLSDPALEEAMDAIIYGRVPVKKK
jgi:hypothetical protein